MVFRDLDKQALKANSYTVLSKITLLNDGSVFTEDDHIIDWNYEDYRYVPNTGFIGQFVERILDGSLQDIPNNKIFENQEINLQIGIVNAIDNQTTWYDYGNFLITKVTKEDTTGNYTFESSDYTKKFNAVYEDTIQYPCLAVELANNVCGQAGLYLDTVNSCYYYIIGEDGLSAGNYSFNINSMYNRFTLNEDLIKNDVLMFVASTNQLVLKKVRDNTISREVVTYVVAPSTGDYTLLTTRTTDYADFTNNDFVIENNQYDEDDTLRKVMQDIGKLAYSWIRVGEDNKVHIDFAQANSVDTYDELTTDEYYVSKKSDLPFGPVNKVLLGMSNIEGENLYKTSSDYTEETECAIKIYDNNLTYTEELRAIALNGCERLFGIQYMPLEIETIGHPWLNANEMIKLTNVDGEELYTYPFNRTIKYAGYIDGIISSETGTIQESKYEYESEIVKQINKTSIVVDKNSQTITALVSDVSDAQSNITTLQQTTNSLTATVEHLDEEYEQNVVVRRDAEGNPIEVEDAGNYELEDFKIYGGTSQDGEPTPSNPVDIDTVTSKTTTVDYSGSSIDIDYSYDQGLVKVEESDKEFEGNTYQEQTSGKNLWSLNSTYVNNNASASWVLTDTQYILPAGTYTFSCNAPSGAFVRINYKYSDNVDHLTDIVNGKATMTFTQEIQKIAMVLGANTTVTNIQLETGSQATSYEPYTYGPTPNPNYPQEIQVVTGNQEIEVCGKNLFSGFIKGVGLNNNTGVEAPTDNSATSDYIPVDFNANPSYYLSGLTSAMNSYVFAYDKNKQGLGRTSGTGRNNVLLTGSSFTAGTPRRGTIAYIRVRQYGGNLDVLDTLNTQLEIGDSATTFEQYKGNKYEINLGKNLFDKNNFIEINAKIDSGSIVSHSAERLMIIECKPNTTYSFTKLINSPYQRNYVGETSVYPIAGGSVSNTASHPSDTSFSYTTTANAKYIVWWYYCTGSTTYTKQEILDSIQIEKGSQATSFSPYFTPIELCKINDYKDNLIKVKLPDGYTQVDYIEGTGTQWLDTGYTPTEKTKMQFRFRNIATTGDVILGFFKTQDNQDYRFFNYNNQIYWDIGSSRIYGGECLSNTDYYFEFGNYYVRDLNTNNTLINNSTAVGSFTGNSTIKINYYERTGYEKVSKNRVYLLKIYENNVLVRDYLPCYRNSDGKTGLYDLVNDTFITNQGTGEFVIGEETNSWYVKKKVGKIIYNGSETWTYYSATQGSLFRNGQLYGQLSNNYYAILCNYYKGIQASNKNNRKNNEIYLDSYSSVSSPYLDLIDNRYTNANDFKTWLSSNNMEVYFLMAVPTYFKIDNQELINQLETLNNCEFYSNITHYITTSSNLPLISNFSISDLPYKVITISDEDDNSYAFKPLFRNLELCKIGDYIDYLYRKDGKWYKHSEIGKLVFDGSESGWTAYKQDNNIYSYYKNISTAKINYTGAYNVYNYFKWASGLQALNSGYASIGGATATKNGNFIFCVGDTTNELANFKTWLSTHNTIVYYVLETPTETEITDEEIIPELNRLMLQPLYRGYNEIYLNDELCDKLSIRYLTDSIFNDTYATKSQLSVTNENVSALVTRSSLMEDNITNLTLGINNISTEVTSVQNVTADLENSINYLNVDMSGNSIIIPTSSENKPYVSTTYQIPYNATFKGEVVNPTVNTSSASVTGITLSFTTGFVNVTVNSTTAIPTATNSFLINFTYTNDGKTYLVSKTLNVALSVEGKDGKDGTSVTILGSYNTLADLQAAHPTGNAGDSYMVGTDLYVWDVSSSSWKDVGQIKGTDGISTYFYVRYSENADGNPMTASPTSSSKYIGVCSTTSSTAPTSYTAYTWSKYAGDNGETTYLHIKYSEDGSTFVPASEDADEGDTPSSWVGVLTDTNETASTTFDDYTWYKFTEDIDNQLTELQNQISQNSTDIGNNYTAIIEKLNDYAKAETLATLTQTVETNQTNTEYAISVINDLQVNGVSQVRTEKGFTFDNNGMTIDATNSITKSVTDTNGIQVIDKSGSQESELLFAGYDETTQSSIVRTENLSVSTYFNIGTKSRFEDYKNGTGVFI